MFTIFSLQKRALVPLTMLVLLAFLLAGCGKASTSTGTGVAPSPTNAPVSTKAPVSNAPSIPAQGYGTANGCPSNAVIATLPKADVTVQYSEVNTTITAHDGDVIEIRLPFGHKWGGPLVSQGILQLQSPEGYAWKTNNVCVWHFVAHGTGTVSLNFSGQPLCKPKQLCPMFIIAVPFKIDVK